MLWFALAGLIAAVGVPGCDWGEAVHVDARVLAAQRERWWGRCVAVDGFVRLDMFYADAGAFYASAAADNEQRGNSGWLGLYLARSPPTRHMVRASVVGRFDSCGRLAEAAERESAAGSIVMLTGSCHHNASDLLLVDAAVRVRGRAAFRPLVGEAARRAFGDLVPGAPNRPVPSTVVSLADAFVSAIRRQDEVALERLVQPWSEQFDRNPTGARAFRSFAAGQGASPLSFLRGGSVAAQRAYFVESQPELERELGYMPAWHICFCRIGDCTGQWPISHIDSVANLGRPYACLRAESGDLAKAPPDGLSLERRLRAEEQP